VVACGARPEVAGDRNYPVRAVALVVFKHLFFRLTSDA